MKRIITWLFTSLIIATISVGSFGCATSKRVTVATITTVHQSMLAWRDYVAAGHATAADEARVKAAYERYQAAVRVAKTQFALADAHPETPVNFDTVMAAVSASTDEVIALIQSFLKKKAVQ